MTHPLDALNALRRPSLLVSAAKYGATDYKRDRDLKRLMRTDRTLKTDEAVDILIREEAEIELTRQNGEASYSVVRHVELLIALMAESRLLPNPIAGT